MRSLNPIICGALLAIAAVLYWLSLRQVPAVNRETQPTATRADAGTASSAPVVAQATQPIPSTPNNAAAISPPVAAQATQPARTLVFVVPGTAGNAGFWPNIVDGKATFASELQRAAGPDVEIYPYLWNGSFDHAAREAAAQQLAAVIDEKSADFDRVCLVGHSFGGDVALRASGLCKAKIDIVVCMATPHAYLTMQTGGNQRLNIPVYCTWEARQNIKSIVNLYPGNDDAVVNQANENKSMEVTEAQAIPLTQSWQEHSGFPRLVSDTLEAHFFQLQNNLVMAEPLNVADVNLRIQSFVTRLDYAEHSAIHSRRMGYAIGELIRDGVTRPRVAYLARLIEPSDTDTGEPVDLDFQELWMRTNAENLQRVGWRLNSITVNLLPQANAVADNLDGSVVSPYVMATGDKGDNFRQLFRGQVFLHTLSFTLPTNCVLYNLKTEFLYVMAHHDNNLLADDNSLGGVQLTGTDTPPPALVVANPAQRLYWSANLFWVPVHY